MTILKSTLLASALILGTVSASFAQDAMSDKAKTMATDTAKEMATDQVKAMGDTIMTEKGKMDGADMKTAGKVMMQGGSVEDAAMAVAKDNAEGMVTDKASDIMTDNVVGDKMLTEKGKMDGEDMVTAGKVMMSGGSAAEAAKAVAKDNAKNLMMNQGTVKSVAPMTPVAPSINCPYGTTAQANGTCMITGDYQPRG